MPGLPLFFLTRFSAAKRFGRESTRSIRSLAPERSVSLAAVGASPLRRSPTVSPRASNGSSSCLDIWGDLPSRLTSVSLSSPFGPSPPVRLLRPRLTSRSASTASPFQAQGEISPGKSVTLLRATAGFTSPGHRPSELCGHLPARPARRRLRSGSCTSARGCAPRFLPTVGHPSAVAVRFSHDGLFLGGLSPPGWRPCRAHIGIGVPGDYPEIPSHTTWHAGPHQAVR